MMTKEERREIIAILSDDQTVVERNILSRRVGDLRHEIVIFHRSVSCQHYLELKVSTLAGEILFMGRFDSVFREHNDTFVDAFSVRVPEEDRKHRYRQLLILLRDQVRPFLNSLASIADLHSCMASRLEGRGLVTVKLRALA